jgi:hypothetical protein
MSQQGDFADIIQNSDVVIFSQGTKTKAARVLIGWLPRKLGSYIGPLSNFKIQQ